MDFACKQDFSGAAPARFRRQRILIVGCGDVGLRVARQLQGRLQLLALTSSSERVSMLRAAGITPLAGNLDAPATLRRLAGIAQRVLHLAPPPGDPGAAWWRDARTAALVQTLRRRSPPSALVYGSTSGVYGDCSGDRVHEMRAPAPHTPRAHRRSDAERSVRALARHGVAVRVLRIPGIYANDRAHGTPRARLEQGSPVLRAQDDVYTNHIHADDLARACVAALWRGGALRTFNVCDDTELKMGDYFEQAADIYGLPRPPRVARAEAQGQLSVATLSFMGESRRLDNRRMKSELRLRLRFPTVREGLRYGL